MHIKNSTQDVSITKLQEIIQRHDSFFFFFQTTGTIITRHKHMPTKLPKIVSYKKDELPNTTKFITYKRQTNLSKRYSLFPFLCTNQCYFFNVFCYSIVTIDLIFNLKFRNHFMCVKIRLKKIWQLFLSLFFLYFQLKKF